MGENKEENNNSKDKNEQNKPSFIRETIKKKQRSKKEAAIHIAILCAAAVLFGVIAAFVYVNVLPIASKASGKAEVTPRVTITPEEGESTATSSEAAQISEETPTPTSEPTPIVEPQPVYEERELTVDDYIAINQSLSEIADEASASVVTVTGITSQMDYFNKTIENEQEISGVIVAETDTDYYVLVEDRIFENVERIQVTFCDGCIADATFQRNDPITEFAGIKIDKSQLPAETLESVKPANIGSSLNMRKGDICIAIGSPMGYSDSIAFGNITSASSTVSLDDSEYMILMTDIIGSKSGSGALVNTKGQVVGIISQSYANENENTVIAMPLAKMNGLIEALVNNEARAYVGIKGQEVTSQIAEKTGIPKGVIITEVASDSPAMLAGITAYDVISQIGEEKISTMQQYMAELSALEPGAKIKITVYRKGAEGYSEIEFEFETGEI